MKRTSFVLAVLAALSMVITPVAPSYAAGMAGEPAKASVSPEKQKIRQQIAAHAERGEAAILSKAQLDRLAVTNPKLHAKVMTAYHTNTIPQLTPSEKKTLQAATDKNLAAYKAGGYPGLAGAGAGASIAAGGWIAIGLIVFVLFLIVAQFTSPGLAQRLLQILFPWAYSY